jgi:hypothetical protein
MMQVPVYIGLVDESETVLHAAYRKVADRHKRDAGIRDGCRKFGDLTERRLKRLLITLLFCDCPEAQADSGRSPK